MCKLQTFLLPEKIGETYLLLILYLDELKSSDETGEWISKVMSFSLLDIWPSPSKS